MEKDATCGILLTLDAGTDMKCTVQTRHRGCLRNSMQDVLQCASEWCLLLCTERKALGLLAALQVQVAHTYPPLCRHHARPDHPWETTRSPRYCLTPFLSFVKRPVTTCYSRRSTAAQRTICSAHLPQCIGAALHSSACACWAKQP